MKKSKEEIKEWLLENAININGEIDLRGIDFDDKELNFSDIKAKGINNSYQESEKWIYNYGQDSRDIDNSEQTALNEIDNMQQEADFVNNYNQIANDKIDNELQIAVSTINNQFQSAPKVFN